MTQLAERRTWRIVRCRRGDRQHGRRKQAEGQHIACQCQGLQTPLRNMIGIPPNPTLRCVGASACAGGEGWPGAQWRAGEGPMGGRKDVRRRESGWRRHTKSDMAPLACRRYVASAQQRFGMVIRSTTSKHVTDEWRERRRRRRPSIIHCTREPAAVGTQRTTQRKTRTYLNLPPLSKAYPSTLHPSVTP